MTTSRIRVGIISAAHGIRGQVKIRSFIDDIFSYELTDKSGKPLGISSAAPNSKYPIASVEGIDDRNAAEALRGTEIFASAAALPVKHRLAGLEARLENNKYYGEIIAVHNFGAGDIIEIKLPDGKNEMLPLNKKFVEVKDGWVLVHPPEYVEGKG